MIMKNNKNADKSVLMCICEIIAVMIILQISRMAIEHIIFMFAERNNLVDDAATAVAMTLLTLILVAVARLTGIKLSVLPNRFSAGYVVETVIYIFMMISTAYFFCNEFFEIFILVYGCLITPVFEELVFRGYAWNTLSPKFKSVIPVYIINTVLFAVWHLGYWEDIAFRCGNTEIVHIMIWKVIIGFAFGVILGALRCRTHNCYSTILLHGLMNIFGK